MVKSQRKTIGRSLPKSVVEDSRAASKVFTLASGKKAIFKFLTIPADEVKSKTWVNFETNGRSQEALTKEAVNDILQTISLQQFFPAIGVRRKGGIEVLDGSRRRMAAIYANVGLDILYTDNEIDVEDARQLASDIQTAREHNLRETGLRLQLIKNTTGCDNKSLAKRENLSQSKVTRAIQAASVPEEMVSLFPVQYELSYADYKVLFDIANVLDSMPDGLSSFCETVRIKARDLSSISISEELKISLLNLIKSEYRSHLSPSKKESLSTEKLWDFESKDSYARKKTKGRSVSYEFNRIPSALQKKLDQVIKKTLEEDLS